MQKQGGLETFPFYAPQPVGSLIHVNIALPHDRKKPELRKEAPVEVDIGRVRDERGIALRPKPPIDLDQIFLIRRNLRHSRAPARKKIAGGSKRNPRQGDYREG